MRICRVIVTTTAAAILSWAAFANAQVTGAETESETDQPDAPAAADAEAPTEVPEELMDSGIMEEIEVVVGPQGRSVYELEMRREALLREAIYTELRMRERRAEEVAWRQQDPDLENPQSRIKWGYSAQAEQRMRRENDYMYDLSIDRTKPASILRVEF